MIYDKLCAFLSEQLGIDPADIRPESKVIDDLGADSLDVVELIMSLEDEFGIAISDEDAAQLYTVGRIVDYLEKLQ